MYDLEFESFSLESTINGLKFFGNKYFSEFLNSFEVSFTLNDSILIFNKKNYIGIEILSYSNLANVEVHPFISGVYLSDFYPSLNLRFDGFYRGGNTDLAEVFIDLIVYESINKDDFYDLFQILLKYAKSYEESLI